MRHSLLASLLVLSSSVSLAETNYLFRNPALSSTQIVFSYAGDLWSVPREGGDAKRLTTGVGVETDPRFSPDGSMIAFTGEYDGNVDVFVMPASGGTPRRLTYHPDGDWVIGWTPDGKRILFASTRASTRDRVNLFTLPMEGGFPEQLPLPLRSGGFLLARCLAPCVRSGVPMAGSVETLSGRSDQEDLDRRSFGFERSRDST